MLFKISYEATNGETKKVEIEANSQTDALLEIVDFKNLNYAMSDDEPAQASYVLATDSSGYMTWAPLPKEDAATIGTVSSIDFTGFDRKKASPEYFSVFLRSAGARKLSVVKFVKELLFLGLKESKDLVDSCPGILKEGLSADEAHQIAEKLSIEGATIGIRRMIPDFNGMYTTGHYEDGWYDNYDGSKYDGTSHWADSGDGA